MRALIPATVFILAIASLPVFTASTKKVVSPETSAGNEDVDIVATLFMTEEDATTELGMDPGPDVAILKVKVTPKTDKPVQVAPDDFILLAHNDGERSKPFTPHEIAGDGALVVSDSANQKGTKDKSKKTSTTGGLGGIMMGGGGGGGDNGMASPGNPIPHTINTKLDEKSKGNPKLLEVLTAKQLPTKETSDTLEGLLYFPLKGKHKLKDMEVLYRGPAGKLNLEFEH